VIDLEDLLGCTGIVLDEPVKTLAEQGYRQRRPPPLELTDKEIFGYVGETKEQARARRTKEEIRYHNNNQRKCSRIDAFIRVNDNQEPCLYIIFPQVKATVVKANPLHAALLGNRSTQGEDRIGMKAKMADKILVAILCKGNKNPEGKPTWEAWYNKKKQLVVEIPIGPTLYSEIPLYEEES
jgi:hypothetical protein